MGRISLQEKIINEVMNLPDDKIPMLVNFIEYLKFLHNKQSEQSSKITEIEWQEATGDLIALSGICSSSNGDLADNHDKYLYGSSKNEF